MEEPFHTVRILKQPGFTLVELLITLIIAGILLTIGVPSYQDFVRKNQTITNANNLVTALNLARSEAIKRGVQVTLQRKGSSSQTWEGGWDVYTDINGNGALNDDADANLCETGEDCLLRTYADLPAGFTLRTGGNFADWVGYLPSGLSSSGGSLGNDTFRLCAGNANTSQSRAIIISPSGRPRTETGTNTCP
ncbi:MAG: GspH/FimT family pseudopilin [Cycloclasticus sp.]